MATYAEAQAILNDCHNWNHASKFTTMGQGEQARTVCQVCHYVYHAAYKLARKEELAAHKLTLPTCQRCGKGHAAKWRVWGWKLCGRCKGETMKEHNKNVGGNLVLGMAGPCIDTRGWKAL